MAGIESKKEKRAALSRDNPNSKPIVMVIPERDVPGINATACARPINIVPLKPSFSSDLCAFLLPALTSAKPNKKPNKIFTQ